MPIAMTLLTTVAKQAGAMLYEEYFPKKFEESIASSVEALSHKIDSVAQDAAFLRSQPIKSKFIEHMNYFQNNFLPKLESKMKDAEGAKVTFDAEEVSKLVEEMGKYSDKMRDNLAIGKTVLGERVQTCDYPLRQLFEILQGIVALRLSYLSWRYFLISKFSGIADANGKIKGIVVVDELKNIRTDYNKFKDDQSKFINKSIDEICKARLDKMSYTRNVKRHELTNKLTKVECSYKDDFESTYPGDPFSGGKINCHTDAEKRFWNVSFLEDAKDLMLASAFADAEKWKKEYDEHRNAVINLNKLHVSDPAKKVVDEIKATPELLPSPKPPAKPVA